MPNQRSRIASLVVTLAALILFAVPQAPADADPNPPVSTFTFTPNMEPLGWVPGPNPTSNIINSDLAFSGNRAYQGAYDGFHIIDISNPEDPQMLNDYNQCLNGPHVPVERECVDCGEVRTLSAAGLCHECEQAMRERDEEAEERMAGEQQRRQERGDR